MLNDLKIKRLKPTEKVFRVADHSGLCLEVRPSGGKYWRFRYRYLTKANMLTIGQYPEISLAEARLKTLEFRKQLANGVDPSRYQQEELLKAIQENTGHSVWLRLSTWKQKLGNNLKSGLRGVIAIFKKTYSRSSVVSQFTKLIQSTLRMYSIPQ